MRIKFTALATLLLASCANDELPPICRSLPPESSENYDEWLRHYKAAECEERIGNLATTPPEEQNQTE